MFPTITGHYTIILNEGTDREQVFEQSNVITNWFLNRFKDMSTTSWGQDGIGNNTDKYIRLGLSDQPAAATDGNLIQGVVSKVVSPSAGTDIPLTTNGAVWSMGVTFVCPMGTNVFQGTIKELGFAFGRNNGTLGGAGDAVDSRAVLTTPITLALTDDVTAKFTLTLTGSETDATGSIVLDGTTYNYKVRRNQPYIYGHVIYYLQGNKSVSFYGTTASFGAVGAGITGSVAGNLNGSWVPVEAQGVRGERRLLVPFGLTEGNLSGGIKYLDWPYIGKFEFTPAIPKTSDKKLTLTLSNTVTGIAP